jgi:hypothetical protein
MSLPVKSRRMTSPANGRPRELVGALGADNRNKRRARGMVILHILADAAQLMHDRHADQSGRSGLPTLDSLQDVRGGTWSN